MINWPFLAKTIKASWRIQQKAESTISCSGISVITWFSTSFPAIPVLWYIYSWNPATNTSSSSSPEGFEAIGRSWFWSPQDRWRWVVYWLERQQATKHKRKTLFLFSESFLSNWASLHWLFMSHSGANFQVLIIISCCICNCGSFLSGKCYRRWKKKWAVHLTDQELTM